MKEGVGFVNVREEQIGEMQVTLRGGGREGEDGRERGKVVGEACLDDLGEDLFELGHGSAVSRELAKISP